MSDSSYRIGVISDTHGLLPRRVYELFEGVDLILHAGDVGREDVLFELGVIATVRAVRGNVDDGIAGGRPLALELETPAGRIAVTHGHQNGAAAWVPAKLIARFREFAPRIVVFGHTHAPYLAEVDGVTLFNPGSASRPRQGGPGMVGLITGGNGTPPRCEHLALT